MINMKVYNKKEVIKKGLDIKDQKILKCLFENGRDSFATIAKKVSLSKESANYRIRRMENIGLIRAVNTIIDARKLGWKYFMVFIRLRSIRREEEIIKRLIDHPNSAMIQRLNGSYDLVIKFFAKTDSDINDILKEIGNEFENDIDSYEIDILLEEELAKPSFLWKDVGNERQKYVPGKPDERYELDDIDYGILKEISKNSRMPLSEICTKLSITREIASYRLRKMEKNRIILKYRPSIWSNLEFDNLWYFIMLKFGAMDEETNNKLHDFLLNHKNTSYFYKTVGSNDMEIDIKLRTTIELNEFLHDLRIILGDSLKRYEVMIILKEYKYTYFPDCMLPKE